MKKLIILITVLALGYSTGYSRAQYSLLQSYGIKCINCHYNAQGGGLRNNPGWASRNEVSLAPVSQHVSKIASTNTLFNEKVTFGVDFRFQNAKWPAGTVYDTTYNTDGFATEIKGTYATERDNMIMQFTPYLLIEPVKWLGIEGMLNAAYYIDDRHYPGQQPGAFSVNFRFNDNLPYLRVGYFQPTIGTKYEDHTLMIHRVANGASYARPVKPDDYAEWGAQLDYEKYNWLDLSLGVFQTKNLNGYTVMGYTGKEISNAFAKESLVDTTGLAYVAKVTFIPNAIKNINYFFGGCVYYSGPLGTTDLANKYFLLTNLFLHVGLSEKLALMTEYIHTYKQFSRATDNFLVELNYKFSDAWNVFFRAERGNTEFRSITPAGEWLYPTVATNQFVLGTHIFPLPYIDILPEYRIYRSEQLLGSQQSFAIQLHVFY